MAVAAKSGDWGEPAAALATARALRSATRRARAASIDSPLRRTDDPKPSDSAFGEGDVRATGRPLAFALVAMTLDPAAANAICEAGRALGDEATGADRSLIDWLLVRR